MITASNVRSSRTDRILSRRERVGGEELGHIRREDGVRGTGGGGVRGTEEGWGSERDRGTRRGRHIGERARHDEE